jgi:hypothetical protein
MIPLIGAGVLVNFGFTDPESIQPGKRPGFLGFIILHDIQVVAAAEAGESIMNDMSTVCLNCTI